MIFIALLGSTVIFLLTKSKRDLLLDPLTMFFVGLLYYGYMIPVTMTVFGRYELPFLNSFLDVTDGDLAKISFVLVSGHLAFALGYRALMPRASTTQIYALAKESRYRWNDGGGVLLAAMFILTLLICLLMYPVQLASVLSGYQGKILARYEASTFAAVYNLASLLATVIMVRTVLFGRRNLLLSILFVIILFLWSLLTFSKQPMIFAALVLFATASRFAPRRQLQVFGLSVAAGIAALVLLVPSFSYYRFSGHLTFINPQNVALPYLFSDAAGPFSTLVLAVRGINTDLPTLWESFFLWMPRGIWPDRPLDAAEEFARAIMPGWLPGYGVGFSPFAEARIRFGLVLSPLLLLMAGLTISSLQRLALRLVPVTVATALMLVVQGYILFIMHRGAFSAILTGMGQFWIPFLLLGLLVELVMRVSRKYPDRRYKPPSPRA